MEIFLAEKKEVEKKNSDTFVFRAAMYLALFRNEWFMLDEMFHQNASRFGSFHLELHL